MEQVVLTKMNINKSEIKKLGKIRDHLNNLHEKSMFRYNVSVAREMHDSHFFNPYCPECIIILNQYYHHLMGASEIEEYFKTKGFIQSIEKKLIENKFRGYDGKGFSTTNTKKKSYE